MVLGSHSIKLLRMRGILFAIFIAVYVSAFREILFYFDFLRFNNSSYYSSSAKTHTF